jgi:hypothetical protein
MAASYRFASTLRISASANREGRCRGQMFRSRRHPKRRVKFLNRFRNTRHRSGQKSVSRTTSASSAFRRKRPWRSAAISPSRAAAKPRLAESTSPARALIECSRWQRESRLRHSQSVCLCRFPPRAACGHRGATNTSAPCCSALLRCLASAEELRRLHFFAGYAPVIAGFYNRWASNRQRWVQSL